MPASVFLQIPPVDTPGARRAADTRSALIQELSYEYDVLDLPTDASTVYVWPSASCPVGCAHCNFAAPTHTNGLTRHTVVNRITDVLTMVNGMHTWKAVLSGGGEPMEHPDFCRAFIRGVDSPMLAEIELITSGHYALDPSEARQQTRALTEAWHGRSADLARAAFTIRLSLDWFHVSRLGLDHATNLIRLLGEPEFHDLGFYIRSVLLENDNTFSRLANLLGATLTEIEDYKQGLLLPDGREILIYYKNLILDGRMTRRRLSRLPVGLPNRSRVEEFGRRFLDDHGRHIPARVYNGPTVRHLDGLACVLEDDGSIKVLEGSAPDRVPQIWEYPTWAEALRFMYCDPLTVFLVEEGPHALAELVADRYPDAVEVARDTNQLYYLTDRILASPQRALYATLRVVHTHIERGVAKVGGEALASAWRVADEGCQS